MTPHPAPDENPYASPVSDVVPIDEPASLTPIERRTLLFYQRIRLTGPAMSMTIGVYLLRWLMIAAACAIGAFAYSYLIPTVTRQAVSVSIGIVLGLIISDASHWRSFVRLWPRLRDIIDWEKLDRTLHAQSPPSPPMP